MRGSQRTSASRTRAWTRPCSCAVLASITSSQMPQPNSGRITRSPGLVPRMIWIACSMASVALDAAAMPPVAVRRRPETPSRARGTRHRRSATDQHRVPRRRRCPTGRSIGSLQVCAVSPARAAGLPLIVTRRAARRRSWPCSTAGSRTCRRSGCAAACSWPCCSPSPPRAADGHVGAHAAVDDPAERVRHRHRRGRSRRLDQVDVDRDDRDRPGALPAVPCVLPSVDRDRRALDRQRAAGLERQSTSWPDLHRVGVERHRARRRRHRDVAARSQVDLDLRPDTSITILCLPPLPTISIRSAPLVSSNLSRWPERERKNRQLFSVVVAVVVGRRIGLAPQRAEDVRRAAGRRARTPTSTSSSLSGRKNEPAVLAAHRRGDASPVADLVAQVRIA